jgi:hypothetical protein
LDASWKNIDHLDGIFASGLNPNNHLAGNPGSQLEAKNTLLVTSLLAKAITRA